MDTPSERRERERKSVEDILFKDLNPSDSPVFILKRAMFRTEIDMQGQNVCDAFNDIKPTKKVPYVFVQGPKEVFFAKLYLSTGVPLQITEMDPNVDFEAGLFFRIVDPNKKNEYLEAKCTTDPDFPFRATLSCQLKNLESLPEAAVDVIKKSIFALFPNGTPPFREGRTELVSVGGQFTLPFRVDRIALIHFIGTDDIGKRYLFFDFSRGYNPEVPLKLFFDEFYGEFSKFGASGLVRPTIYLTRGLSAEDPDPATTILLSVTFEPGQTVIGLRRAQTRKSAEKVKRVLWALFSRVDAHAQEMDPTLRRLLRDKLSLDPKEREEKEEAGPEKVTRVALLQQARPDLFGTKVGPGLKYAQQCQSGFQPLLREGDAALQAHKAIYGELTDSQVMEYPRASKDFYVCIPQDDRDTSEEKRNIFPGLKVNSNLMRPHDSPHLLPCCFKKDQSKSENRPLYRYTHGQELDDEKGQKLRWKGEETTERKIELSTQGFAPADKVLNPEMLGHLPLNIAQAWPNGSGCYRQGVTRSGQSFLACLAQGVSLDVKTVSDRLVEAVRVGGFENTFGYTPAELGRILTGSNYVEPRLFVGAAQVAFSRYIFLYAVSAGFPKGNVCFPRAAFAYQYPYSQDPPTRGLVILLQQLPSKENPWQCEIVVCGDQRSTVLPSVVFKACTDIERRALQVSTAKLSGYESYILLGGVAEGPDPKRLRSALRPPSPPLASPKLNFSAWNDQQKQLWKQYSKQLDVWGWDQLGGSCFYDVVLMALIWNPVARRIILYRDPLPTHRQIDYGQLVTCQSGTPWNNARPFQHAGHALPN